MSRSFAVRVEERSGWTVVVVSGRVDSTTAADLEAALEPALASGSSLALDVAAVDFLSSPGLRVLLTTLKAVQHEGGRFRLLSPNESVRKVLAVSGIEKLLDIGTSLDEG